MNDKIHLIAEYVLNGQQIDRHQAKTLITEAKEHFFDLMFWSNKIREEHFGNKIKMCSIVPGRLGGCSQDCKFCAQSAKHETDLKPTYTSDEEIMAAAKTAKENGVPFIGIVYSGKTVTEEELCRLEKLIPKLKNQTGIGICAGLGIINDEQAIRLKKAGLDRYNHNLETSERYFKKIVTTHDYSDRTSTIRAAKNAKLGVCAGGIFGIGENWDDRIDMAMELRNLQADTIPLNFLHPIEGTPMGEKQPLPPREILTIVALYRFMLPNLHIKVAGGRVLNLRDLQSWIFMAGATNIMVGNYLTTAGRTVEEDVQMVKDLGLLPELV